MSAMNALPAFAAGPEKVVEASATLAYNIKGLKHNVAVQKAYIDSQYIYITQRSKGTCYFSRLRINEKDAIFQDEMVINNAGHCETMDMYTYNGKQYFYIGSNADPATSYYWSQEVARIQYSPGATVDYTALDRFTDMNYANKTGTKLGTTYRVAGGGNSKYTIFRIQTAEKTVTWSIYDTAALNRLLDGNKRVSMNSAEAVKACITSFTQSGSAIVRPNDSFQGVDLLGNAEIYTPGGVEGDTPQIAMMSADGTFKTLVKITNVGKHEIEGVQLKNGNVYFTIVTDPSNKRSTQKIYYIPDSLFSKKPVLYRRDEEGGAEFPVALAVAAVAAVIVVLAAVFFGKRIVAPLKTTFKK
jgi:hypothetical protein